MPTKYNFSLLNADNIELNKSWNYKNVTSPFYRLYVINAGSGWLSTPDEKMRLEEGYLYLVPAYTLFNQGCDDVLSQHYIHFTEEAADGNSLFASNRRLFKLPAEKVDILAMEKIISLNPGRDLRTSDNPEVYEKAPVIRSFAERNRQLPLSVLLETEGLIMQLLAKFIAAGDFKTTTHKNISPKIPDTLNYIGTHLQETLTVELLAARVNLSADYFSKLFQQETAERPLVFIQQKRVEKEQFLLVTSVLSLAEIGAATGIEDMSYFSRIFKRTTGHTPGKYRQLHAV